MNLWTTPTPTTPTPTTGTATEKRPQAARSQRPPAEDAWQSSEAFVAKGNLRRACPEEISQRASPEGISKVVQANRAVPILFKIPPISTQAGPLARGPAQGGFRKDKRSLADFPILEENWAMTGTIRRYKVISVKKPGDNGTKKLLAHCGEDLVCVRYVEDLLTGERFKTVELAVEQNRWSPKLKPDLLVGVKIAFHEKELQKRVKDAGGCWDPYDRVWLVKYKDLAPLGLEHRKFTVREEEAEYVVQ
jgi:hypothetical protein